MSEFQRARLLPETNLPDANELMARGKELAKTARVQPGPFLQKYSVASESEFKRQRMTHRVIMFHSQIGYRQLEKSKRAYAEIYKRLDAVGYRIDRYGICLDWNMG